MKKFIALFVLILCTFVCAMAQTDSTAIVADTSVLDTIWNLFPAFITTHAKLFGIITFIAWILEQVIPLIKWVPGNSMLAALWNWLKNIIKFLSTKKPA